MQFWHIQVPFRAIPKYPTARPDFLAKGPRALIERTVKLKDAENPAIADDADELAEAASFAPPKVWYYESDKILGKLYRDIDEHKFLEQLQKQAKSSLVPNQDVIGTIWNYVLGQSTLIQWEQHLGVANDIKERWATILQPIILEHALNVWFF